MRFCIFDTETTGLPKGGKAPFYKTDCWPYVVQISWLIYDTKQGGIIEDKDRIIKIDPDIEITPKSIEKHGITMERSQASEYLMKDVLVEFGVSMKKCDIIVELENGNMLRFRFIDSNLNIEGGDFWKEYERITE